MSSLLVLAWLVPLLAAALAPAARLWWLPAVAALPAAAAAGLVPLGERVEIPWLLLGVVLGLDETSRIFLAFTSVLWLAAGIYSAQAMRAGPNAVRFRVFFLLAMAGNLWLILGQDLVSFYVGFSLMGLASYGLVVHDGDRPALRAGKVYLVMTLASELALFAALVRVAAHAGGLVPERAELVGLDDLTVGLLIFGLAIKAGLVPVHVWLPLAHPAAPVPASAVLSGAMIKVALLGWLRFLPVGEAALFEWGVLLVFTGLATLFVAIPIGLVQSNPKVILAYSSVSKMGLMTLVFGAILVEPGLATAGILALSLYAAHHALVKGGLFLGVGLRHHSGAQALVLAGMLVLALSLAGVPGSAGAVVKYGIKPMLAGADWPWLTAAVALSTAATLLLMLRFLWVIVRTEPHPEPGYGAAGLAWGGLIVLALLLGVLLGSPAAWGTDAAPILTALLIALPFALVAWRKPRFLRPAVDRVPPGDLLGLVRPLLVILGFVLRTLARWWGRLLGLVSARLGDALDTVGPAPPDPERALRRWSNAGAAWLGITSLLLALSLWSLPGDERPVAADRPPAAASEPVVETPEASETDLPVPPEAEVPPATEGEPGLTTLGPYLPSRPEATAPDESAGLSAELTPEPAAPAAVDRPPPQDAESPPIPEAPDSARTAEPEPALGLEPPVLVGETPAAVASVEPAPALGPLTVEAVEVSEPTPETEPTPTIDPADRSTDRGAEAPALAAPLSDAPDEPEICDPDRAFLFSHPEVAEPLRLRDCERSQDGAARRIVAPPLTNALVELVQRHLADLGHDPGPIDGLIGPRTRSAIRAFQRDLDEPATGALGFYLLEALSAAAATDAAR